MRKSAIALVIFVSFAIFSSCNSSKSFVLPESSILETQAVKKAIEIEATQTSYYAALEYKGVKCNDNYELIFSDTESNNDWIVFTCSPPPPDYQTYHPTVINVDYHDSYTKVIRKNSSKNWTISHNGFVWSDERFQHLAVYRWSQDGNYLFFTSSGTSNAFYFPDFIDEQVLYRFNLNTGVLETILPFTEKGYAFSLSPNTQYLAYVAPNEKETVHVLNLRTWTDKQKETNYDCIDIGGFAWKPDNSSLIFTCGINGWESGSSGFSTFLMDINSMKVQTILENDSRLLIPFPFWTKNRDLNYWADADLLTLWSLNNENQPLKIYVLDVNTGVVTLASMTDYGHVATATSKP